MKKLKDCLRLFLIFFKIGLFTFGGGYAMISVITHEVVEKKKYIDSEEFSDVVAIAESTPGPIAINSATYIGYRKAGVLGAISASIGVALPSLIIIYLISLFFAKVLEYPLVKRAFSGIQCGVSVLILSAGVKLLKNVKKNVASYVLMAASLLLLLLINFTNVGISTIYFVIVGAILGIAIYYRPKKKKSSETEKTADNRPIGGDLDKKSEISDQNEAVCASIKKGEARKVVNIVCLAVTALIILTLLYFGAIYKVIGKEAISNLSQSSFYKGFLKVSELFATFFKVGLFSFGGGYGMLPLMLEETVGNGWLTELEFANFLAVAESTPGPIAVNMATYVGSTQGGLLGSVMATIGVITPSVIVILIIVALLKNFLQYTVVRSALYGMKPVICGMILATGINLALTNVFPKIEEFSFVGFSPAALCITMVIAFITVLCKKVFKKNASPILLIVVSACIGMLLTV